MQRKLTEAEGIITRRTKRRGGEDLEHARGHLADPDCDLLLKRHVPLQQQQNQNQQLHKPHPNPRNQGRKRKKNQKGVARRRNLFMPRTLASRDSSRSRITGLTCKKQHQREKKKKKNPHESLSGLTAAPTKELSQASRAGGSKPCLVRRRRSPSAPAAAASPSPPSLALLPFAGKVACTVEYWRKRRRSLEDEEEVGGVSLGSEWARYGPGSITAQ